MPEKTIVKMVFGSHLYGTDTLQSDMDYKGIFLPTCKQAFLGKIPKSYNSNRNKAPGEKNSAGDIDTETYSLQYFIKLACEGQTIALDMLHAPENMLIESSSIWTNIVANRHRFYTKNLKAFIGYARKQAAKYGIKSSRLDAARNFIKLLEGYPSNTKLTEIWHQLPTNEHCHMLGLGRNNILQYQICGKIFQQTAATGYVLDIMQRFEKQYGQRARDAAKNKNLDWKALSHAMRAALQVKELLTDNTITFPLRNAEHLIGIKAGLYDYSTVVAPNLEGIIKEVEELSKNSNLPEKVDRDFWDGFIVGVMEQNCC
jgi:hypothetical protein